MTTNENYENIGVQGATLASSPSTIPTTSQTTIRSPSGSSSAVQQDGINVNNTTTTKQEQATKKKKGKMVCRRAKVWSPQVEEAFRFQQAGWKDINEYSEVYGLPQRHYKNNFISMLQNKKGLYMYFRNYRECADKYLNRIKLYEWVEDQ